MTLLWDSAILRSPLHSSLFHNSRMNTSTPLMETALPAEAAQRRRPSLIASLAVLLLLAASAAALGLILRTRATSQDFISYWSSARLMAAHANPYDPARVMALENQAGGHFSGAFLMRNPPWALFLVLPLGWLPAPLAAVLWSLAVTAAGLVSIRLLQPAGMKTIPLNAFFFGPLIACVASGQSATFLLLGVSLFIVLQEKRPFRAGVALLLPMMKPHLFLLFWPLLLLNCLRRGRWRVLAGTATAVMAALAFALCFDPHVWSHYLAAVKSQHIEKQFLPNISCALRTLRPRALWLQAVPTLLGLALMLWYRTRSPRWEWSRQGAMVLAVSAVTAPYSWPTDQVLLLPAVLAGYERAGKAAVAVLTALNGIEFLVILRHPQFDPQGYLWTGPVWMAWCLWAYGRKTESDESVAGVNGSAANSGRRPAGTPDAVAGAAERRNSWLRRSGW